jgi:hypothetical protein
MYEESVITPVKQKDSIFYIVPRALEDQFVDLDCDTAEFEYARLDIMLEIINGYKTMPSHATEHRTDHYQFVREGNRKGILAKAIPIRTPA